MFLQRRITHGDRFLMTKLFGVVFAVWKEDIDTDERLSQRIKCVSFVEPPHLDLPSSLFDADDKSARFVESLERAAKKNEQQNTPLSRRGSLSWESPGKAELYFVTYI